MIEALFRDIDERWKGTSEAKTRLRLIGSTALMLQSDYARGTKDSDVLETANLSTDIKNQLRALAGVGTALHTRHRLYLDFVAASLPFLPQRPRCHDLTSLNASLKHFELEALDVVDVVVSKLKRFNANDVSDIEAMVKKDLLPHDVLIERFKAAVDHYEMDARAEDLPKYVENLHAVERDMLVVPETDIELPPWLSG
jgi:Nucleotidyltransferase of unknown function (DUF6036)